MKLEHVTWTGPPLDDEDLLLRLPINFTELLRQINGFIQFHGGLHVRGACQEPRWHSLRDAWDGEFAFHRLYRTVRPEDLVFGEDCLGDQFLLRDGQVWRLAAETGEVEPIARSLSDFFRAVEADPVEYLSLYPLMQFQEEGGHLEPGQLLSAFPPFCTKQSAEGVHFAAVSAAERRRFLAHLAARLSEIPEGGEFDFHLIE
jgi:hypothetical protein